MRSLLKLAMLAALSLSAFAQNQKIAVIDMQGALLNTKEGQKAGEELKVKFSPKEAEFQKRQQDIQAKQDAMNKLTSDDAKAAAAQDIQNLTQRLQRDAQDAQQDFQDEENKLLGGLLNKMQAVLNKYAADNQITLVIDISQQPNNLLYAHESANITAAIVAAYDKAPAAPAAPAAAPTTAAPKPATAPRPVMPTTAPRPAAPAAPKPPATPAAK